MISGVSTLFTYLQSAVGAITRTVQDKLHDEVSAFDFMTADQISDVRSHAGNVDVTVALQKALDSIFQTRKVLHLPAGRYRVSDSLRVSEFSNITGEGRHFTIISGVESAMAKPVLVNAAPAFIGFTEWRDFGILGGTHGVKIDVTSETAYMNLTNIFIGDSTQDNFYVNKLLQTSNFTDCKFSGGNRGVVCAAFTANLNNFTNCEFQNHLFEEVFFQNSEVNNFIGCEFGNVPGLSNSSGIVVFNARDLNFIGCYFENGHRRLLSETGSDNSVRFDKCHFTGAVNGTYQYYFESNGIVEFGSNSWYQPSVGAPKMLITGYNQGKLGTPTNQVTTISAGSVFKIAAPSTVYPATAQKDLLKFTCAVASNGLADMGSLTGALTLTYQSYNTGGFGHVMIARRYNIGVHSAAGTSMEGGIALTGNADVLSGTTITVGVKAGATPNQLIVEALFTGNATPAGSLFGWAFESDSFASSIPLNIIPTIA